MFIMEALQFRSAGDNGDQVWSLEKEMATHSGILAWEIAWTEEPVGPQSMGLQKVGHDWVRIHCHGAVERLTVS